MSENSKNTDIIYQIYPLTFYYGEGSAKDLYKGAYGNLKGVLDKVDYIKSLGVDSVWICPFYKWDKMGLGYDIIDYYNVGDEFGTNEDFAELTDSFHKNDIKVIVDQVYNHCSKEHEWFDKSVKREEPYSNYFVWADSKGVDEEGRQIPPNNWPSAWDYSGSSAWSWNDERGQFYMHSFDASMPNLNINNPKVQEEIEKIAKHWFDLGADGFRLDASCHYGYDPLLRDNPIDENTGEQKRIYDINNSIGVLLLNRLTKLGNSYEKPKSLLSEFVFDKGFDANEKGRKFIAKSSCESFYIGSLRGGLKDFRSQVEDALRISPKGEKLNWALGNHDMERVSNRWFGENCSDDKLKLATKMLTCLPGSICVYQGEELGLPNPDINKQKRGEEFDPRDIWRVAGMPWDGARIMCFDDSLDSVNGKMAVYPSEEQRAKAANLQEDDNMSILNFTRQAIQERQSNSILKNHGNVEFIETEKEDVIAFKRYNEDETDFVLCAFNFSDERTQVNMVEDDMNISVELKPYGYYVDTKSFDFEYGKDFSDLVIRNKLSR